MIDRSRSRDTPKVPVAHSRSHICLELGSRNPSWPAFMCERDNTGRTYERKRSDQTMSKSSCETGAVHICDLFEPQECWNFLRAAGYASV